MRSSLDLRTESAPFGLPCVCRWYLSSIGQHDLLDLSEEKLLAMDVQELQRWIGVRSSLERQLDRPPSQDEWSRAVGFQDARAQQLMGKGQCFKTQLRTLFNTSHAAPARS